MAGLANFILPSTDPQSVGASSHGHGSDFKINKNTNLDFDAVLQSRKNPAHDNPQQVSDRSRPDSERHDLPTSDRSNSRRDVDRTNRSATPSDTRHESTTSGRIERSETVHHSDDANDPVRKASGGKSATGTEATDDPSAIQTQSDTPTEMADIEDLAAGHSEGESEGDTEGESDGESEGDTEGESEGHIDGDIDGEEILPETTRADTEDNSDDQTVTNAETTASPVLDIPIEITGENQANTGTADTGAEDPGSMETAAAASPLAAATQSSTQSADGSEEIAAQAVASATNQTKKGLGQSPQDMNAQTEADAETAGDEQLTKREVASQTKDGTEKPQIQTASAAKQQAANFAAELAPALRAQPTSIELPQGSTLTSQTGIGSATFKATPSLAKGAAPTLPVRAIALHIASKAAGGVNTFQIRLDPPELGRIDVKLEIAGDGKVSAQLTVDRPETLEALVRDQRGLERTLQNAGLNTKDAGLSFNLRQDAEAQGDSANNNGSGEGGSSGQGEDANGDAAEAADTNWRPGVIGLSAIDIRV